MSVIAPIKIMTHFKGKTLFMMRLRIVIGGSSGLRRKAEE